MVATSALESDAVKDSVRFYGSLGPAALSERLRALDEEPDLETVTSLALAGAGTAGLIFGFLGSRLWRLLAWISLPLLFEHARGNLQAPAHFLKSLGLRSRREIQDERNALKSLRGDFQHVKPKSRDTAPFEDSGDSDQALSAVRSM